MVICHQCGQESCTCKFYPADYTLQDWLWLRRGWLDPQGDTALWQAAQNSTLGPNPILKPPPVRPADRCLYVSTVSPTLGNHVHTEFCHGQL